MVLWGLCVCVIGGGAYASAFVPTGMGQLPERVGGRRSRVPAVLLEASAGRPGGTRTADGEGRRVRVRVESDAAEMSLREMERGGGGGVSRGSEREEESERDRE